MADKTRLEKIYEDINNATKRLDDNNLIKKARESVHEAIGRYTLSDDIRADKLINFEIQLALGMMERALAVASESDIVEEKLSAAKFAKLEGLAKLKKEYGYGNATEDALGTSTHDGVVDYQRELTKKQIEGFLYDMMYKLNKNTSEMISMLAMNGVDTPQWMSNVFRITSEAMSHGKVDLQVNPNPDYVEGGDEPQFITTVEWRGDATEPDGI